MFTVWLRRPVETVVGPFFIENMQIKISVAYYQFILSLVKLCLRDLLIQGNCVTILYLELWSECLCLPQNSHVETLIPV